MVWRFLRFLVPKGVPALLLPLGCCYWDYFLAYYDHLAYLSDFLQIVMAGHTLLYSFIIVRNCVILMYLWLQLWYLWYLVFAVRFFGDRNCLFSKHMYSLYYYLFSVTDSLNPSQLTITKSFESTNKCVALSTYGPR